MIAAMPSGGLRRRRSDAIALVRRPRCLLCGRTCELASRLCDDHERAIDNPDLTPEQVRGATGIVVASLVSSGGRVIGLRQGSVIGRAAGSDVVVLHASVGLEHARLDRRDGVWTVEDLGTMGGTSVDDVVARPTLRLLAGARVRFGGVAFYFWPNRLRPEIRPRRFATPATGTLVFRIATAHRTFYVARGDASAGLYMDGRTVELSEREHQLLSMLAERAAAVADPELAWLSTWDVAEALGFRFDLGEPNVRELARRLRHKLASVGLETVLDSRRCVGYRLDAAVTLG
jgi:hypothetical protein